MASQMHGATVRAVCIGHKENKYIGERCQRPAPEAQTGDDKQSKMIGRQAVAS